MRNLVISLTFSGFVACGGLTPEFSGADQGARPTNSPRIKALTVSMGGLNVQLVTLWDSQAKEFCAISAPINGMVYCQSYEGIAAGRPLSSYASAQVQIP